MLKKLILTAAAGTALVASSAFADGRDHDRGWHHGWEHHRYYSPYVVVTPTPYYAPAPVYVAPAAPVYAPAPAYSAPAPVYYPAPVYAAPAPAVSVGFRIRL